MNRIDKKFKALKNEHKKAFIVFITAGYPNLDTTKKLLLECSKIGVDIVELGVPFSDPLADGPIIQEASQVALKRRVNINGILSLVKEARRHIDTPICLMSYYNPIFCFGEERFVKKCVNAGVDGVIIPDLPPEEGSSLIRLANKSNLDIIFFLSPTSPLKRIRLVSKVSKGFIYYVSLTGVTGPRQNIPSDLAYNIKMIKKYTTKPVAVGFGVSMPFQVKQIYKIADGVIVGSAIIKKLKENLDREDLVKITGKFIANLKNK